MACSKRNCADTDSDIEANLSKRPKAVIDLEDVKCRICLEFPKEGMYLCSNGHSVCSECISKLTNCPTCRVRYPTGPRKKMNHSLDDILSKMRFDCSWRQEGCNRKGLNRQQLSEHEEQCTFNPTPVPLCRLLLLRPCDYQISPKFLTNPSLGYSAAYLEHLINVHIDGSSWIEFCGTHFVYQQSRSSIEALLKQRKSSMFVSNIILLMDRRQSNFFGVIVMVSFADISDADSKLSWFAVCIIKKPQSAAVSVRLTLRGNSAGIEEGDASNLETSWNATVMSFQDYYQFMKKGEGEREKMKFSIPWSHLQQFYLNEDGALKLFCTFSVGSADDSSSGLE